MLVANGKQGRRTQLEMGGTRVASRTPTMRSAGEILREVGLDRPLQLTLPYLPAARGRANARLALDMIVQHFFDPTTATITYVVHDAATRVGVIIDPVADFDPATGKLSNGSSQRVADYVDGLDLDIPYVLETHAHADHLSGVPFFQDRYGSRSVIGWRIAEVQRTVRDLFHLGKDFPVDGSQFDVLLHDGEALEAGPLRIEALPTPGHTPACMTYRIDEALFVGDVLFMPDYGVARCDFPGGSPEALYDSVQRLYALPGATRIFTGHDYRPGGRPVACQSTIAEQRQGNVHLDACTSREAFVRLRRSRDAALAPPALFCPAMQVNVRAGRLPEAESDGVCYLKLPIVRP